MDTRLNTQTTSGISKIDQDCLKIMQSILSANGIPDYEYSLHGYAESKVCLEHTSHGWDVFIGERGQRYDESTHRTARAACIKIIRSLCDNEDLENRLVNEFQSKVRNGGKTSELLKGKAQIAFSSAHEGAKNEVGFPVKQIKLIASKQKKTASKKAGTSPTAGSHLRQQTD